MSGVIKISRCVAKEVTAVRGVKNLSPWSSERLVRYHASIVMRYRSIVGILLFTLPVLSNCSTSTTVPSVSTSVVIAGPDSGFVGTQYSFTASLRFKQIDSLLFEWTFDTAVFTSVDSTQSATFHTIGLHNIGLRVIRASDGVEICSAHLNFQASGPDTTTLSSYHHLSVFVSGWSFQGC